MDFTQDGDSTRKIPVVPSILQRQFADIENRGEGTCSVIETGDASYHLGSLTLARWLQGGLGGQPHQPKSLILLSPSVLSRIVDLQLPHLVILDERQEPSEELSCLARATVALATTPRRAIDHVRRGNLQLTDVVQVLVMDLGIAGTTSDSSYGMQNFIQDVQFLAVKFPKRCTVEYLTVDLAALEPWNGTIFSRNRVLARSTWDRMPCPLHLWTTGAPSPQDVTDILFTLQGTSAEKLVVCATGDERDEVSIRLHEGVPPLSACTVSLQEIVSGAYVPRSGTTLATVTYGLNMEECISLLRRILSWPTEPISADCILPDTCREAILTSKETLLMNNETKKTPADLDVLAGKIQLLAGKTKADSNPEELDQLKKLIKKNVPFLLRGYFTAYLLRELLSNDTTKPRQNRGPKPQAAPQPKKERPPRAEKPQASATTEGQETEKPQRVIPEGAKTLYLNIGKMKRLYSKDLSQLLQTELGITREDIYGIRIYDKYSFITMSQENCEKAIEKLNGMDFKGRTASVSYSTKE